MVKNSIFKPNFRLRANGVLAFLWGKWLKAAFLAVFLFVLNFHIVFASSDSLFSASSFDWVKSQINSIVSSDGGNQDNQASDSQSLIISQDSYLIKTSSPDASTANIDQRRELTIDYSVRRGDTLSKIADDYGISLNTLLWSNNLTEKSILKEGQELKILPIDGVLYTVKKGDTLAAIAKKYKTDTDQIIDFNDLPADGAIKEDMDLILPNAETVVLEKPVSKNANKNSAKSSDKKSSSVSSAAKQAAKILWEEAEKIFIVPVSGLITQIKEYNHRYIPYPAVDIGNACGTPAFSDADGVVTVVSDVDPKDKNARSKYLNGGYGNNIRIKHADGSLSLYAHLYSGSILVSEGDFVKQGQKIAEIGGGREKGKRMVGAGNSSGCHLHYEIRNGVNILANKTKYRRGLTIRTPAANLVIDTSDIGAGDDDQDNFGSGGVGVISEPYKPKE